MYALLLATQRKTVGVTGSPVLENLAYLGLVGFEVLTAVVMNSAISWDITPCSQLSVNRRFGGTYGLHLENVG
jgi:hypothetical protein